MFMARARCLAQSTNGYPLPNPRWRDYVRASQTEHRVLSGYLGRWLVLEQADRAAAGRGIRGDRRAVAALGPDETETSQSEQEKFPQTPLFGQIEVADGRIWMLPSGAEFFCGDLPEDEQKLTWATAYPPSVELFGRNAPGVGWKTKPSWYIVANHDQAVHPELERAAAKRMGAATYDIDSSHVPMLSHPDYVLDVIRAAAAAI